MTLSVLGLVRLGGPSISGGRGWKKSGWVVEGMRGGGVRLREVGVESLLRPWRFFQRGETEIQREREEECE